MVSSENSSALHHTLINIHFAISDGIEIANVINKNRDIPIAESPRKTFYGTGEKHRKNSKF